MNSLTFPTTFLVISFALLLIDVVKHLGGIIDSLLDL